MKQLFILFFSFVSIFSFSQDLPKYSTSDDFVNSTNNLDLDVLAGWHDEFLTHIYKNIESGNLCPNSETFINNFNTLADEFFKSKGVTLEGTILNSDLESYSKEIDQYDMCLESALSIEAQEIICALKSNLDQVIEGNMHLEELYSLCDELKISSNGLELDYERVLVGGAITIAKSSAMYWDAHIEEYVNQLKQCQTISFTEEQSLNTIGSGPQKMDNEFLNGKDVNSKLSFLGSNMVTINEPLKVHPIVGKMARADASGAIRGAVVGFLGGPASPVTVFAGAIVGAGAYSAARGLFYGFFGL